MQNINKFTKKLLLVFFDFTLVIVSIYLSYFFRYEDISLLANIDLTNIILPGLMFVITVYFFNIYSTLTRFLSFEFLKLAQIFSIFSILYFIYVFIIAENLNTF